MRFVFFLLLPAFLSVFVEAKGPTHKDLRYDDEFERSVMDMWIPKSDDPTPIIIFFHGGAFKMGDKTWIPFRGEFLRLLKNNVALASVGYPLLGDKGKSDTIDGNDYAKILKQTTKSLRFLLANANKYNLDPKRIVVAGSSAGALISQHLTYKEKLDVSVCIAIEQPYEVKSVIEAIDPGEAPLILYTWSLYTWSQTTDLVHSPLYARQVDAHCKNIGVPSFLYGSKESGLPEIPKGQSFSKHIFSIISNVWNGDI